MLIAIDDVQWLDPVSAQALAFAAQRLADERVGFLFARRPGPPSELERVLARGTLERLELGPLSVGAIRRLLFARLGLQLPRQLLLRVARSTLGNPLFALEMGRTLLERTPPRVGEDFQLIDEPCEAFDAASDSAHSIAESPERVRAVRLLWRGEPNRARTIVTRLLALADERGEPFSYVLQSTGPLGRSPARP